MDSQEELVPEEAIFLNPETHETGFPGHGVPLLCLRAAPAVWRLALPGSVASAQNSSVRHGIGLLAPILLLPYPLEPGLFTKSVVTEHILCAGYREPWSYTTIYFPDFSVFFQLFKCFTVQISFFFFPLIGSTFNILLSLLSLLIYWSYLMVRNE